MVDQDLRVWRTVTEQVESRRRHRLGWPAERLAGSFEYDRRALLGSLGQTARGVLQRHDHQREATQLAASVREAITHADAARSRRGRVWARSAWPFWAAPPPT